MRVSPRYIFALKTPLMCEACRQAFVQAEALEERGPKRILTALLVIVALLGLAGLFIPGFIPAAIAIATGEQERPITVDYPPYKPPFAHVPSPPDPR
jgi:hypothetical protein